MPALRKRYWLTALLALSIAFAVGWWFRPLPLSGPWRAQIVDAETGQPIEGVIVLAVWDKRTFGWPHPDRNYHDSEEVVSDKDGRIVINARVVTSRHPFEVYIGPLLTVFKPGYGKWHYEGTPQAASEEDPANTRRRADLSFERLSQGGTVIAMPRLKTVEDRKEILRHVMPALDIPREKFPQLLAAYNQERISLGYPR